MARTSTEFKMKDGILEALNNYLAERGYSQGELEGCIGWGKKILPALTFLLVGDCCHYIQFCDMGDTFVLDEWVTIPWENAEYAVDRYSINIQRNICTKTHNELVNFIKNF